jgi:hypothetical protein
LHIYRVRLSGVTSGTLFLAGRALPKPIAISATFGVDEDWLITGQKLCQNLTVLVHWAMLGEPDLSPKQERTSVTMLVATDSQYQ